MQVSLQSPKDDVVDEAAILCEASDQASFSSARRNHHREDDEDHPFEERASLEISGGGSLRLVLLSIFRLGEATLRSCSCTSVAKKVKGMVILDM